MGQCPHCRFEHSNTSPYCGKCGTLLDVLVPYEPSEDEYVEGPQLLVQPEPERAWRRVPDQSARGVRTIFYFAVGLPVTFLGLISAFSTLGSDERTVCLSLSFALGLLFASIVLFYRSRRRVLRLTRGEFLLWILGATIGAFMAFCLEIAILPDAANIPLGIAIFCGIITLYGVVLSSVALW